MLKGIEMKEKEVINRIEYLINHKEFLRLDKIALERILELYQQEKDKNLELRKRLVLETDKALDRLKGIKEKIELLKETNKKLKQDVKDLIYYNKE